MTVSIYDGVFGGFNIREIIDSNYNPDFKTASNRYSGGVDPQEIYILSGEPVVTLEMMDLYNLIGNVSLTAGLAVTSPGTITIPWQQRADGGTFAGSGNHFNLSGTLGLLVITEISGTQDSETGITAKLEACIASSDGLAAPVALNGSVTPAGQAFQGSYSLGPVAINGSAVPGVTGWTYKPGLEIQKKRFGGGVYPTMYGINITKRDPQLEITFEDAASAQAFGHFGALATTASCFARKNEDGGTRADDADSVHVGITLTNGLQILNTMAGKGQDNASFTRTVMGKAQAFTRTAAISS